MRQIVLFEDVTDKVHSYSSSALGIRSVTFAHLLLYLQDGHVTSWLAVDHS